MKALYLIRHGETDWNAERRLQGQKDLPLSRRGEAQARALRPVVGAVLGQAPGDVTVISSPLIRARRTTALLGLRVDCVDPSWQEANLGEWTGRTREELVADGNGQYAAWRAGTYSPPGAESQAALRHRVAGALESLSPTDIVLVVTHGGPIRAACRQLIGLDPAALVPVEAGSLTAIDLSGIRPRLRSFNLTPTSQVDLTSEPAD